MNVFAVATHKTINRYRKSALCANLCGQKPFGSRHWEYPWAVEQSGVINAKGLSILDVAPDFTFPYAEFLISLGHEVIFIDLEKRKWSEDITWGLDPKKHHQNFRVMDLRQMSFADDTFDRIFCISVLEHIVCPTQNPDHPRLQEIFDPHGTRPALRQMCRCLKTGGRLVITVDIYGGKKWAALFEQWDLFSDLEYAGFDISDFPPFDRKEAFSNPQTYISTFHGPYITLGFALYK